MEHRWRSDDATYCPGHLLCAPVLLECRVIFSWLGSGLLMPVLFVVRPSHLLVNPAQLSYADIELL
jgi:hypothetical protein